MTILLLEMDTSEEEKKTNPDSTLPSQPTLDAVLVPHNSPTSSNQHNISQWCPRSSEHSSSQHNLPDQGPKLAIAHCWITFSVSILSHQTTPAPSLNLRPSLVQHPMLARPLPEQVMFLSSPQLEVLMGVSVDNNKGDTATMENQDHVTTF